MALTELVTESLPAGATGLKSCFFLEFHWNAFVGAFELGAVCPGKAAVVLLPPVIVLKYVVLVGVFVFVGAFEADYGNNPGVDVEMRSEPKSVAEPGPDGFGCERDHMLSPEVVEYSRVKLGAELHFACEVECKRPLLNIQRDPPEVLTGATVGEHCPLDRLVVLDLSAEGAVGKWDVAAGAQLGCVVLVWVSRAGQEMGPGSKAGGE